MYTSHMSSLTEQVVRRTFYPLRLAQEASSITAIKDTYHAALHDNELFEYPELARPFALMMGAMEFVLPASMRFIRENDNDELRPLRNLVLFSGALASDVITNGFIVAAGFDSTLNVAARRIVLNYATHMGADLIQKLFPDRGFIGIPEPGIYSPRIIKSSSSVGRERTDLRTGIPKVKRAKGHAPKSSQTYIKRPIVSAEVIQSPPPVGDIMIIKTQEKGSLLRDEKGVVRRDSEGRLLAEFPGPPKYTVRIPEALIGTNYEAKTLRV